MYVTLSSTSRNMRIDGKITKYYIKCKTLRQAYDTLIRAKLNKKATYYVRLRFSAPKYPDATHVIVDNYKNIKEFQKNY